MAKRIVQLDGVRTLAIGAVFLHHSLHVKMLWAGVDLFFILSGFLITGILIGRKESNLGHYFGHFYERRARRILPPYLVFLILASIFFGWAWTRYWYRFLFLMNLNVAFPTAGIPDSMTVLWSLAVEEQFYLVWPFIVYFVSETAIAWIAGGLIVAAPVLRWLCTPLFAMHWPIYSLTPFRMDLLAMGALLAVIWKRSRPLIERYGVYAPILSVLAVGLLAYLSRSPTFYLYSNTAKGNVWIYECSLIACTGIILWALSGRHVGILTWTPVAYIGRISYTVYLIHVAVLIVVGRYLTHAFAAAAMSATIVIVYAAISWKFFEQPILYWKPRSRVRREAEADEKALIAGEN